MSAYHPTLSRPKLYTASKVHRAGMWKDLRNKWSDKIEFTSRWVDMKIGPLEEASPTICREGWIGNIEDVCRSNYLVCFAMNTDPLSGTIVEIGAALAMDCGVFLVGDCERYSTWKHHPLVRFDIDNLEDVLHHISQQGLRL